MQKKQNNKKIKNIFIKDINVGNFIDDEFLVVEKHITFSQKGVPYLILKIQDNTGKIEGRIWNNVEEIEKKFTKGDIVRIMCRAITFRDIIQLLIFDLFRVKKDEINLSDFLPTSKLNIEKMFNELLSIINSINCIYLKKLLKSFFDNTDFSKHFKNVPAAKTIHHAYIGGLLEHTLAVVKIVIQIIENYSSINLKKDLLITGAIIHDIGKVQELSYIGTIDYTDNGRLIGHLVIGLEMLNNNIKLIQDFPMQLALELKHLILSHHGLLEYGSPKRPKTIEAIILHYVDDLDAKVKAVHNFIENSNNINCNWTPYHKLLDRVFYKGEKDNNQ